MFSATLALLIAVNIYPVSLRKRFKNCYIPIKSLLKTNVEQDGPGMDKAHNMTKIESHDAQRRSQRDI